MSFLKRTKCGIGRESPMTYLANMLRLLPKRGKEASGLPSGCVDDASKEAYVRDYLEHEDIELEPGNIAFSAGFVI